MNKPNKQALLLCDSGGAEGFSIGQGHLVRCQAFAAHLEARGWYVSLLELSISEEAQAGKRYSLSLEQLRHLSSLSQLPMALPSRVRLLLIDSYQLPLTFYRSCVQKLPLCCYLALDDTERLGAISCLDSGYPKEFFVIQASLPSLPRHSPRYSPHYLRGLEYQVLRPEFTCNDRQSYIEDPGRPYSLLVPGSAFSLKQVEMLATEMRPLLGTNLLVILSLRQARQRGKAAKGSRFLADLSAVDLRSLYTGARAIFCAAGQSLLEALAVNSSKVHALLTADNQLPLLKQYGLPHTDLRAALKNPTLLPQASKQLGRHNGSQPLPYLGDGKAIQRILQRLGLHED